MVLVFSFYKRMRFHWNSLTRVILKNTLEVMFTNKKMNKCRCWNLQTSAFTNYHKFLIFAKKKRNLTTYYKPNTNIELVFSSSKISSLFSMKDRVWDPALFVNRFLVAVKLITLVTWSEIYQLGLRNIWKKTKSCRYTNT